MVERRDMFEGRRARWKGSGEDISWRQREIEEGQLKAGLGLSPVAYQLST